ncbi:MAG: hypothetical protein PHE67_04110 [Campylobacterales bacterium]|nr:hypothetical protein [Campylobacterales bacterium]
MQNNEWAALIHPSRFFSRKESDEILSSIVAEMELGSDFISVIENLILQDYKKNKKISGLLQEIKNLIINTSTPIEDALLMYRLIYKKEYILIKHSSNLVFAFTNILDLRENGKVFNNWLFKFLLTPFLIILFGLIIQIPLSSYFMGMFFNDIYPAIQSTRAGGIITPSFPFFLENLIWTKFFLMCYIAIAVVLVWAYRYVEENRAELMYGFFPTKFYDDFYYYFRVMDIMKKAQQDLTSDAIFLEMGEYAESDSMAVFFKSMGERAEGFYKDFDEIAAPATVVMKIKRGEQYNTLWNTMNYEEHGERKGLVWFLRKKRDNKINLINTWASKSVVMFSYMLVIAYIGVTVGSFILGIVGVL